MRIIRLNLQKVLTIRRPQYVHTTKFVDYYLIITIFNLCWILPPSPIAASHRFLTVIFNGTYQLFSLLEASTNKGFGSHREEKNIHTIINIDRPYGIHVDVHDNRIDCHHVEILPDLHRLSWLSFFHAFPLTFFPLYKISINHGRSSFCIFT